MNALGLLNGLFRHMEWADAIVLDAIQTTPAAASDPQLRARLYHSHFAQRIFLNVWRGAPLSFTEGENFGLPELAAWAREFHGLAREHLERTDDAALDGPLVLPWAGGYAKSWRREPAVTKLGDALIQMASHTTHHRGQILTRLRDLGGEPPMTDFIVWSWKGKPAASWSVIPG